MFKAEVEKQKQLRGLTNADIAKAVGRAKNTVDIFMMNDPRQESKILAEDIAKFLGIKLEVEDKKIQLNESEETE